MQTNIRASLQKAYDFLVASQNSDGGWGYQRGGMSYVEPTAFALIALFSPLAAGGQNVPDNRFQAVTKGLVWLRAQQHTDGGWGVMKDDNVSGWMTYPVVWVYNLILNIAELTAYYGKPEDVEQRDRGRGWILNTGQGRELTPEAAAEARRIFQIDTQYRGWGWNIGDTGWVIPTSLAMIALTVEDPPTVRETREVINGKIYLRDRACPDGGWNIGNPWMLGQKLPPTLESTAYAMIAWRLCLSAADFGSSTRLINTGRFYLEEKVNESNSDHSVTLATWAVTLFNEPSEVEKYRLQLIKGLGERTFKYRGQERKLQTVKGQNAETGAWANSAYTTAIATLALNENRYYLQI